jgi:hydrogenase/urease accessory protein HupE
VKRALELVGLLCLLLCASHARAHTPNFSVLLLEERAPGEFLASWEQTPTINDPSAAYDLLRPVFPEHCRLLPPRLDCGVKGLSGELGFDGLGELGTSGIIKIRWQSGKAQALSLSSAAPHVRVTADEQAEVTFRSVVSFVRIGVAHIWLGWDHLLFVLGLLWFASSWRALLKTVTAFTVAHSLTLASASLGLFVLPTAPVEAVIALSIALLAVEMVREVRSSKPSMTRRAPWAVAFAFGLLHGFGFASALSELELGKTALPLALLCFNVGVEVGQLLFVGALIAVRPLWLKLQQRLGSRVALFGQYAVGTAAMFWFFERVVAFFPTV